MRDYYHNRRQWLRNTLGPNCAYCDNSDEEFHLDHIDPTRKKYKINKVLKGLAKSKLASEMPNLQILCLNCHKNKTKKESKLRNSARPLNEMHGTATGYGKFKCRCDLCRKWKKNTRN